MFTIFKAVTIAWLVIIGACCITAVVCCFEIVYFNRKKGAVEHGSTSRDTGSDDTAENRSRDSASAGADLLDNA